LITRQIGKSYKAKHDEMAKYLKMVRGIEKFFFGFRSRKYQEIKTMRQTC
jgi:hypothetical protein